MSSGRVFNSEEKIKLTQLMNEGLSVMQEVETLQGGLNDTIKAVAEEMEIKPSTLKRALKIAYNSRIAETIEENEELNHILETVGRTILCPTLTLFT
jgi:transposase-like protein